MNGFGANGTYFYKPVYVQNVATSNTVVLSGTSGLSGSTITDWGAGSVILSRSNGTNTAVLTGDGGTGGGGSLSLRNASGTQSIRMDADTGVITTVGTQILTDFATVFSNSLG